MISSQSPSKILQLYISYICPYCKPVEFLLTSAKIPFNRIEIDLAKGEQKTPEYKAINPFQKVPAIIDENFILVESNTIKRYLCNSKEIDDHWYPKDPKKRAIVDLYFDWSASNLWNFVRWGYVKAGFTNYTGTLTLEEAKEISDKSTQQFVDFFLASRKYIASDDFITIADLAIAFHLALLIDLGYEASPRLIQYFNDLNAAEPGLKEFMEGYVNDRANFVKKRDENKA